MKKVAFILPGMRGGGAERVASLLANEFQKNHISVRYLLTHSKQDEVIRCDLSHDIPLELFVEMMSPAKESEKVSGKLLQALSSLLCKPFELLKSPVPAFFAKLSIISQYKREIKFLRDLLKAEPDLTVIAFLQPTIPIALLAARGLPNRVIISERGNPERLMKKRYGKKFIEKYYTRADVAVFQTEDAQNAYPKSIADKGVVISNPIKGDLPEPYHGERNKNITTFCRISPDKDLFNLLQAFKMIHIDYPDYRLRIIGNASNEAEEQLLADLHQYAEANGLAESVSFEPFIKNVHQSIIKDGMYVNSSYTEGLCNAMLEAMAIGMPVVCTNCPIGGAKATITDGENGLLVPMKNPEVLYQSMKKMIENSSLLKSISINAAQLRDKLSLESIAKQWIRLL